MPRTAIDDGEPRHWLEVGVIPYLSTPPDISPASLPTHVAPQTSGPWNGRTPTLDQPAASPELVDWAVVASLRSRASAQLTAAVSADRGELSPEEREELGRAIVLDLIEQTVAEDSTAGRPAWSFGRQRATATAVFDALFRLGRFQPLVDDDRVENIMVTGHDQVRLELIDGTKVLGPPVADSDEELIEFLSFLGSRAQHGARGFSEAQPSLHLQLDGGARLAATAWVLPRPFIVIRRHRLLDISLDDLVAGGTLSPVAASFLTAAIAARKSIVVSGAQGAGKTTLVRALCAQIPVSEEIGTFETERELHLDQLPGREQSVHSWEARPGAGERTADGSQAGEYTLDDALHDSFRFNLSRQIVGEVRGKEIWTMLKAMESGTGSISTTHASDAVAAIRKLVTCAMEAGRHVSHDLATGKLAAAVDLIVHLDLENYIDAHSTPQRRRRVAEIVAVTPGESMTGYATTHVFAPSAEGVAVPHTLPDEYRALARHGFDLAGYLNQAEQPGRRAVV
ncbi:CpaF family protein [Georgenia yuyongxinii]|uniref:CpaF family protein n=2 Tax=Georgenia yuyongxinii TaxID=2589797 RepID=A0A552WXH5_9MICO|nr:CpaF family protein [Georgenia yuyongxinii]